ncbi:uncharacterized protein LOC135368945 [Ornithodoros turicata]|uniref:uncharacterized protein LOC135368945 n=1 Tax=Ornithodoros turicata TaxID=34597 RepID=UPI0031391CFE
MFLGKGKVVKRRRGKGEVEDRAESARERAKADIDTGVGRELPEDRSRRYFEQRLFFFWAPSSSLAWYLKEDARNVRPAFQYLGFNCTVHSSPTAATIQKILTEGSHMQVHIPSAAQCSTSQTRPRAPPTLLTQ